MSTPLAVFTLVHVVISLVGIISGFVMIFGLITARPLNFWTTIFLACTVLTSVTGFFFPYHGFTPAIGVGIVSLLVLAVTLYARYQHRVAGGWRKTFVIGAVTAQYLNVFVLVVQLFLKVPALKAMAPKQSEPPFVIAQLAVLTLLIVLGTLATLRFRGHQSASVLQ